MLYQAKEIVMNVWTRSIMSLAGVLAFTMLLPVTSLAQIETVTIGIDGLF